VYDRWFLSRVEPLRASDGTLLYWIGVTLDIEERKQAEFYLAEGQRLAHLGSWAFNAAGFEYWSSELLRIHGLDPSGKSRTVEKNLDLVHPENRKFMEHEIQEMLADHREFDVTKRIVGPDGKIRSDAPPTRSNSCSCLRVLRGVLLFYLLHVSRCMAVPHTVIHATCQLLA
jgi:PAS fold